MQPIPICCIYTKPLAHNISAVNRSKYVFEKQRFEILFKLFILTQVFHVLMFKCICWVFNMCFEFETWLVCDKMMFSKAKRWLSIMSFCVIMANYIDKS